MTTPVLIHSISVLTEKTTYFNALKSNKQFLLKSKKLLNTTDVPIDLYIFKNIPQNILGVCLPGECFFSSHAQAHLVEHLLTSNLIRTIDNLPIQSWLLEHNMVLHAETIGRSIYMYIRYSGKDIYKALYALGHILNLQEVSEAAMKKERDILYLESSLDHRLIQKFKKNVDKNIYLASSKIGGFDESDVSDKIISLFKKNHFLDHAVFWGGSGAELTLNHKKSALFHIKNSIHSCKNAFSYDVSFRKTGDSHYHFFNIKNILVTQKILYIYKNLCKSKKHRALYVLDLSDMILFIPVTLQKTFESLLKKEGLTLTHQGEKHTDPSDKSKDQMRLTHLPMVVEKLFS